MERARRGDEASFTELVRRYERKLLRILERFVRDREQARDLAQETFLRVHQKLDRFDPARRFGPWLFRIGVNLALDALRRQKAIRIRELPLRLDRSLDDDQPTRLDYEPSLPDPREVVELAQEVEHVLQSIPLAIRTVLILRDLEGITSSEVAAIIGKREATVRWRLAQGRQRFKELWEARHPMD